VISALLALVRLHSAPVLVRVAETLRSLLDHGVRRHGRPVRLVPRASCSARCSSSKAVSRRPSSRRPSASRWPRPMAASCASTFKLCEIAGYSAEEMTSDVVSGHHPPIRPRADLAYVRRTLAGEIDTIFPMEKRYVRKDGSMVWVNLTVSLVRKRNRRARLLHRGDRGHHVRPQACRTALRTTVRAGPRRPGHQQPRGQRILLMNQAFIEIVRLPHRGDPHRRGMARARAAGQGAARCGRCIDWSKEWQAEQSSLGNGRAFGHCAATAAAETVLLSRQRLGDEMMLAAIDISHTQGGGRSKPGNTLMSSNASTAPRSGANWT
jgi:hypothetical protein